MENKNRLIELFISLASISSVSGDERAIADYIKSFLKKLGLSPEEDISLIKDGCNTGNLICKIGSGGDFILLSHLDTARPTEGMTPIIQNDKLKSDGTTVLGVDDRAGIAAILYAVENIISSNIPHHDFTIGFTVCEETTLYGSMNFKIPDFIKMGFIFDSSYRPGFYIEKTPGAKSFTINIKGRASHSGIAPEKGINSLVTAAKAITSLNWGRIDSETTANIGKISGGTAINVIPELTSLIGEVRSFNSDKIDYHINLIKNKFEETARNTGAEIEFSSEWDFYPYSLNENSDVCRKLVKALKDSNLIPVPTLSFGGSDANSFNSRGLPSVNIGIGAQNPHSNDEFILIEDLYKAAEIAMNLIRK